MFCEKAVELVKEVSRTQNVLAPYNADLIEQVSKEISALVEENHVDAQANVESGSGALLPTIRIRHFAIQRNTRCLLSYNYHRLRCLRTMRWEFGSILPPDIKTNLSNDESAWFARYSTALAKYMRSIGDEGGVNLAVDLKPPKSLYIEVRCLVDYGRHQLVDGSVILLKNNQRYFLPSADCEEFIRLEIFEHIVA